MATINALSTSNPIEVAKGGSGAATLTGLLTGNGTSAFTANTVTQYGTIVAGASNAVSSIAPSATSGVPLISQGAAANPVYGTVAIAGGGTNATSMTNTFGVNYFDGTSIVTTAVGSASQVLTSNGVGVAPTFQSLPAGGVTSITGTANQITASAATGAVTLSIPATFIAPGSIAATTTLTATLGNITATAGDVVINNTAAATTAPFVDFQKSRSGAVITTGDVLGEVAFKGYDSTQYLTSSRIVATSSGTIAANRIASKLDFYTHPNSTAAATLRATLNEAGGLNLAAPDTGAAYTINLVPNAGNVALALNGVRYITNTNAANGNTLYGNSAGLANMTGDFNAAFGFQPFTSVTSGNYNTTLGSYAGLFLTTGSANTIIGAIKNGTTASAPYGPGGNYTSSESSNICINAAGTTGESNVLRLGNGTGTGAAQLNKAVICGVYNISVGATAGVAIVDSTDQIGTISGSASQMLIGGTKPAWSNITSNAVTSVNGTTNQITSSNSGTGSTTLSLPSTVVAPGSIEATTSIKADTVFNTVTTTSTAGQYQINGTAVLHTYGTANLFVGASAGTFTNGGSNNTCIGNSAGAALGASSCDNNTYVGHAAGTADTGTGAGNDGGNTGIGNRSLASFTGATNAQNTAVGVYSLNSITTGKRNVCLGWSAGTNLTTNDSDNIIIGWSVGSTAGNNNTINIGGGTGTGNGQQNSCKISGITGITVTGSAVLVATNDQLGVAVSSRRFKTDIERMTDSKVLELDPVTFRYTVGEDQSLQSGLIAEEVYEIMPSLVVLDKEGLPQTVKYHDLPVLLLAEIKKLTARIAALEAR